jgi:hypothetical protein
MGLDDRRAHKKVESLLHIEFLLSGTLIAFGFSGAVQGPV